MKRKILIITTTLLILAGGFSSCKKKEIESFITPMSLQMGIYEELDPVRGRTKISFIDNERLIITKYLDLSEEHWNNEEFIYSITDNKIRVSTISSETASEFYFRIISKTKFEIEWLYILPHHVINVPNMIFEKINI